MVTITRPQRLTVPLPFAGAIASGGLVGLSFLLMSASLLERLVNASGIAAILAAAEPPLGFTARIALGIGFGGLVAGFAWFGLHLIANDRPIDVARLTGWFRRGDVHPDAPPRPPLFANRDLGIPFLDVKAPVAEADQPLPILQLPPVERDLPADLDQPLAAFDPAAIPAVPLPAPEPIAPLLRPQLIDPGDRFETFELTPVQRVADVSSKPISLRVLPANSLRVATLRDSDTPLRVEPTAVVAPATESTVHALLARLERGIAGKPEAQAPPVSSLQDTLGDLRRLATGAR